MLREIPPTTFTYEDLFQYIKLNTQLPSAVNEMNLQDPAVIELLNAIKSGDINHKIFSDPNCDLYLLCLFKYKQIEPSEFLSTYDYLLALMEFTDKQPIKEIDKHLKNQTDTVLQTIPFVSNGKITIEGRKYLDKVCDRFKKEAGIDIDRNELENYILNLKPIEALIINPGFKSEPNLLNEFVEYTPSFLLENKNDEYYYYFPSFALQNYFVAKYSKEPLTLLPRFGRIGDKTHLELHRADQHIYPIYNSRVKNNLVEAHFLSLGPFVIAKHDDGHRFWGSTIEKKPRHVILDDLISDLELIKKTYSNDVDKSQMEVDNEMAYFYQFINEFIDQSINYKLNDLAFAPCTSYKDLSQNERLLKYLKLSFVRDFENNLRPDQFNSIDFNEIGNSDLDIKYYLLARLAFSKDSKGKTYWQQILNEINKLSFTIEQENVRSALEKLASTIDNHQHEMKLDNKLRMDETDLVFWVNKLLETQDSAEIWNWAIENQHDNLLNLIKENHLAYFHPLLPLTNQLHEKLCKIFQKQLAVNKSTQDLTKADKLTFFSEEGRSQPVIEERNLDIKKLGKK